MSGPTPGPDDLRLVRSQQRRIDRQRLLLEAAEMIHRSLDSSSLETAILGEAVRLLGAQRSALLVVRGDAVVAREGFGLGEGLERLLVAPLADTLLGHSIVSGQIVAVDDLRHAGPEGVRLVRAGLGDALLTASLRSYRDTYGALALFFDETQAFSEDDETLLRTFAIQAAIALDNRRLMQEKDQLAVRDGLTGVYNRSYLELNLERATKELRRNGGVISILFLDVDGMKTVNDSHGHQAGDRLLRELADLLVGSCRETDVVTRYGGDEFVVLMPDTDADGAREVARKIDDAIARHNASDPGPVRLSASVGMHTTEGGGVDDLLREADRRMYDTKRARSREADGEGERRP